MNIDDYFEAGYFLKPHGFKGGITFQQTLKGKISYNKIDHIMISVNNLYTPFFIEKIDYKGKVIFKLEGVNTDNQAKELQSKKIFIQNKFKVEIPAEQKDNLIGYHVTEKNAGILGEVIRIEEMPTHTILVVAHDGKEILLPNNSDFIIDINHNKKMISYNAPDGLISLYLD
jgi:16S rRNA processing protein RimM